MSQFLIVEDCCFQEQGRFLGGLSYSSLNWSGNETRVTPINFIHVIMPAFVLVLVSEFLVCMSRSIMGSTYIGLPCVQPFRVEIKKI